MTVISLLAAKPQVKMPVGTHQLSVEPTAR